MTTTFIRVLAIGAILQFFVTRRRAGNAIFEGEAEALWLRYPFVVVLQALTWTLLLMAIGAGVRRLRRAL